jgi:AcrR family transcriptional regulator
MSLYNHISSKAALLWSVMETVLAEMKPVYSDNSDWRDRLRAGMRAFRAVGLAHPRVFALNTRPWPGAAAQRTNEDMQTLVDAGFTPVLATYAFHSLVSYVVGFVAWETAAILRDPAELAEGLRLAPADLAPVRKELHETIAWVAKTQDDAFELGLEAMLNGLESLLERSSV